MSWDGYIERLMTNEFVQDAAIFGIDGPKWASLKDGKLTAITVDEIKKLVGKDRGSLFASGVSLAGTKCTLLRDFAGDNVPNTLDIRTKANDSDPDTYSICVGKSNKALIIVKAKKDVHGGKVNNAAFEIAEYLCKAGY